MSKNPIKFIQETTGATLVDICSIGNFSRQTAHNYLNYPGNIPLSTLLTLSSSYGIPIEHLIDDDSRNAPPIIKTDYSKHRKKSDQIIQEIENLMSSLPQEPALISKIVKATFKSLALSLNHTTSHQTTKIVNIQREANELRGHLDEIRKIAKLCSKKPIIASFGMPNSGKSSMLNYLLGSDIAPTSYQPLTSAPVYFHHISDKPDDPNLDSVNDSIITLNLPESNNSNHDSTNDSTHTRDGARLKKIYGHHNSVLKDFGSSVGAYFNNKEYPIIQIDVYLDCDILQHFDYLDVPGFGSGRPEDDVSLFMNTHNIDFIFFLSQANNFLTVDNEMKFLHDIILSRRLDRIRVIATHADILSPNELTPTLDTACKRLIQSMTEEERNRLSVSSDNPELLRQIIMPLDFKNQKLCRKFNDDISEIFPTITTSKFADMYNIIKAKISILSERCTELSAMKSQTYSITEEDTEKAKEEFANRLNTIKDDMERTINACYKETKYSFQKSYKSIMNKENLVETLKNGEYKNKRDDIKSFSLYISNRLNESYKNSIKSQSELFSKELDQKLDSLTSDFRTKLKEPERIEGFNLKSEFDFKSAFAAGISGVTVYGALAGWAAIAAGGSNLGAYILVAKGVSFLSSIGIHLGGTAAVAHAVAAIGGPVTIGISLALLGAGIVYKIMSGNWKDKVAQNLIVTYEDSDYSGKICAEIKKYWTDTLIAFQKCLDNVKTQYNEYCKNRYEISLLEEQTQKERREHLTEMYSSTAQSLNEISKGVDFFEQN